MLRLKSDVIVHINSFLNLIKTQTVKKVRSDNVLEFLMLNVALFLDLLASYIKVLVSTHPSKMVWLNVNIYTYLKWLEHLGSKPMRPLNFCVNVFLLQHSSLTGYHPALSHTNHLIKYSVVILPNWITLRCLVVYAMPLNQFLLTSSLPNPYLLSLWLFRHFFVSRDVFFIELIFPFKHPKSTFLIPESITPSLTFPPSSAFPHPLYDDSYPTLTSTSSSLSAIHSHPIFHEVPPHDPPPPRRPSRATKPPLCHIDYITKSTPIHPISNCLSYSNVSPSYKAYLAAFSSTISEPSFYVQAAQDTNWLHAMNQEIMPLLPIILGRL